MVSAHIDGAGRVALPAAALEASGIGPNQDVLVENTRDGILLRPDGGPLTITDRIAAINLPVAEWRSMKREITDGRLA